MTYLISLFDCVLFDGDFVKIKKNVKYKISNKSVFCLIFSEELNSINLLDFTSNNSSSLKVKLNFDEYIFLFPKTNLSFCTNFQYKNFNVNISLSNEIVITVDGELICEKNVENLKFSHYEIFWDYCFIYFEGKRNYVVILKDKELLYCDYYDECNIKDNEKYFMKKANDSLNHGKVVECKDKKIEKYLVYLDNNEMNLKSDFVPHVFLDCVMVENFNYCKHLLSEEFQNCSVKEFFPEFDYFYATGNEFILIKKNTLAGILKFEIFNNKIINIIHLL